MRVVFLPLCLLHPDTCPDSTRIFTWPVVDQQSNVRMLMTSGYSARQDDTAAAAAKATMNLVTPLTSSRPSPGLE